MTELETDLDSSETLAVSNFPELIKVDAMLHNFSSLPENGLDALVSKAVKLSELAVAMERASKALKDTICSDVGNRLKNYRVLPNGYYRLTSRAQIVPCSCVVAPSSKNFDEPTLTVINEKDASIFQTNVSSMDLLLKYRIVNYQPI